jgi:uncharacterized membrane protein
MNPWDNKLQQLEQEIHDLASRQKTILEELRHLKSLTVQQETPLIPEPEERTSHHKGMDSPEESIPIPTPTPIPTPAPISMELETWNDSKTSSLDSSAPPNITSEPPNPLEKFIGENLSSKVGILILIIGVFIGIKYSIDHQLISPIVRIIGGYVFSALFMAVGFYLRPTYTQLSAIIVSGAIAMAYFISFTAADTYELLNRSFSFMIMIALTIFAVIVSLQYNRQIIAIIGLTGAYAIPFLISTEQSNHNYLFSYIMVINVGILYVSFVKNWNSLLRVAILFTWIIFGFWFIFLTERTFFKQDASFFATLFFMLFFLASMAYHLRKPALINASKMLLIVANALTYFAIMYTLMKDDDTWQHVTGLLPFALALWYLIPSYFAYKNRASHPVLLYFFAGLSLGFLTLTIPIQFDGHAITLFWTLQAVAIMSIGWRKQLTPMTRAATIIMAMAMIHFLMNWALVPHVFPVGVSDSYPGLRHISLTSTVCILALLTSLIIQCQWNVSGKTATTTWLWLGYLLLAIIATGLMEISVYFNHRYYATAISLDAASIMFDSSLPIKRTLWQLIFLTGFAGLLLWAPIRLLKDRTVSLSIILTGGLLLLFGVIVGGMLTNKLRYLFLQLQEDEWFKPGLFYIGIRYLLWSAFALFGIALVRYLKKGFIRPSLAGILHISLMILLLVFISQEAIQWMELLAYPQGDKLLLSVLWGAYAAYWIYLGMQKRAVHWRYFAIVLFSLTLCKLFLYDISHLNTLSKTFVFITIGLLLLFISFLYSKNKNQWLEDQNNTSSKDDK